uniref:Uncharacterized protein n=1 Tax=Ailuropoda melanoleuca TaxID=9646 RepID=A0A7N5P2B9_AILME
ILTIEMTPNITEEVFFRNGCTTGKRKRKQMNGLRREKEELEIRHSLLISWIGLLWISIDRMTN